MPRAPALLLQFGHVNHETRGLSGELVRDVKDSEQFGGFSRVIDG